MRIQNLFLVLILIALPAYGRPWSKRITPNTANIPTSFSSASTSKILTGILGGRSIAIYNGSAVEIAVNCSSAPDTVPSDTSTHNVYVPAGGTFSADDKNLGGEDCYVRSMGSAISSSTVVTITVIGD